MISRTSAGERAALALIFTCVCATAGAQSGDDCELVNVPADPGFSFTDAISRWGSADSYKLDGSLYQVRQIGINNLPIFDETDPAENTPLFRWVNAIHIDTMPGVIADQLSFKSGDTISAQILAENERILRQRKFVGESEIRILQRCGEFVDLEVVTKEVWTLVPGLSYHASGGDNYLSVGVREANLLGTGQRVSVFYKSDADRDSYQLAFENPNTGNSFKSIKLQSDSNSDGNHYLVEYSRPFYALDSRSAWNFAYESTEEILTQYRYGKKLTEIAHDEITGEVSLGFSRGLHEGTTNRFTYGVRYENQRYSSGPDFPIPATTSRDMSLTYPFLQVEHIEDDYAVAYNISQIYRTEDLHLGKRLLASIGYAPGNDKRLITTGEYSDTLLSRPKTLLQWGAVWSGRWNRSSNSLEDSIINFNVDFHRGQTEKRTLYLGFAATRSINLHNGEQVTLGGSTGLRGYDNHYLNGDSSVRFTLEQRYFSNYHFLQLFRLGYAGFLDVGNVYGADEDGAGRTFSNIGLGLRLAPSKSDTGKIIHIDVAYPLQSNLSGRRSLQFIMEAKVAF